MSRCLYFEEVIQKRRGVSHIRFLCGVTGMPCLVDPPTAGHCTRFEWYTKAISKATSAALSPPPAQPVTDQQGALL